MYYLQQSILCVRASREITQFLHDLANFISCSIQSEIGPLVLVY
jgi:hypothetical protein